MVEVEGSSLNAFAAVMFSCFVAAISHQLIQPSYNVSINLKINNLPFG